MKNTIIKIIRIIGSIVLIVIATVLSFLCALIPIPIIGLIPFIICFILLSLFISLIWKVSLKDFDIPKDSEIGQILKLLGTTLFAVNVLSNIIKTIPAVGTVAGTILSVICMCIFISVFGIAELIYCIKKDAERKKKIAAFMQKKFVKDIDGNTET